MRKRIFQYLGLLTLIAGAMANPVFVAYFVSADKRIESLGVNLAIVLLQAVLIGFGLFLYLCPDRSVQLFKQNWKNLVLALVVYLIGEGIIMLSGIFLPPAPPPERVRFFRDFMVADEDLGYTLKPNLENFTLTWLDDGVSSVYTTDAQGFRNPGLNYNTSSLFFIGDSFTFGSWVTREKTYFAQIGKALGREVITYGVGGYDLAQYEIIARDIVPSSDVKKTIFLSIFANDLAAPYDETKIGTFYEDVMLRQIQTPRWRERFSLAYTAAGQVKKLLLSGRQYHVLDSGLRLYRNRGAAITFQERDYVPFEKKLRQILTILKEREDVGETIILLLPSREFIYEEEFERLFRDERFLENEQFGFELVKEIANEYTIPVFDTTAALRARAEEKLYFDIDPHWNEKGHAHVAQAVIEWLESVDL